MNSNERTMLINRELVKLLSIYAPPKHMETIETQVDAINRLSESLNKKFPNDTTPDHIGGTFERAGHILSGSHKTNSWPTSSEITKAVVAGMGNEMKMQNALDNTQKLEKAIQIFTGKTGEFQYAKFEGRAHGQYRDAWIAQEFIKVGLLKDERDAHWRGFDMTDYMWKVKKQRMTMDEWKNHIRIMANMWNCTHEEAAHRELTGEDAATGPISKTEIPIELLSEMVNNAMY